MRLQSWGAGPCLGPVLTTLARACAWLAGLLLLGIALMTCASVIGRDLLDQALVGDFELTGLASGLAVALCLPWCQVRKGNILVDFFTASAPAQLNAALDRLGALLLAAFMALLAWRTALGGANAWANHASSMLLGVPHWWIYAGMVPPLVLCALIATLQALRPAAFAPPQAGP